MVLKPGPVSADPSDVESVRADRGSDRGDIVLGWLTKLTVTLALFGLLGFDAISLGVGRMQAEDRAVTAGRAAVQAYGESKDVQKAYEAALATLEEPAADTIPPESFTVAEDGSVTLTLEHTASTLVVDKVEPIRDWATSSATTTLRPAT